MLKCCAECSVRNGMCTSPCSKAEEELYGTPWWKKETDENQGIQCEYNTEITCTKQCPTYNKCMYGIR